VLATKNTLSRRLCYLGLVLFVGTTVAIVALGVGWRWVVLWGLVLFVLVVTTTARSNGDTAMLVAGAAVVWTLAQQGVPLPKTLQPRDGDTVMVAMGDSFMSGEGAPTYFKGTNTEGKNQCRRAPTSYAARLVGSHAAAVPNHLVFLACSGAVAVNIYSEPQQPDDPPGSNGGLTQLANLVQQRDASHLHVEFVLLSIGGNDALFGSIAKTCVLPGNCAALGNAWLDHLSHVESALDVTYAKIAGALPGVRVIVVPYPDPIGDKKCDDATFSPREQVFLDIFTKALNETVRRAAARAGFEYAETMPGALKGIQLCDGRHGKAGVNFLKANPVEGLTEEALNPANWFHNSLHPNKEGHAAMSRTLERWLVDNPHASTPVDGIAGAGADDVAGLGDACRNLSEADLANCTNDWALERTSGFVLSRGWLILIVIAGAWLIALRIVFSWRTQ
jgi:lysophospholipase L1-like esterase